jgi:beta-glucanase (GH16 family)
MRLLSISLLLTVAAMAQTSGIWRLAWSDEFAGPANSAPDPTKWTYDLGAGGWGNQELETYTNTRENSYLDGSGNLVIQAIKTGSGYTSARLKTQGLFAITYGRLEARIRIPYGQGLWPAFWMLGANIDSIGWPKCGEIDVMENIGKEPGTVHGTIHGTGDTGVGIGAPYTLPGGARFADDFHRFSVIWSPESIEFFVDDNRYQTVTREQAGQQWVFDHPFFLLLNVAVGGSWPGNPDSTTVFPQTMLVDYVRVYERLVDRH